MSGLPPTTVLRLREERGHLSATIDDPATRNAMTAALRSDLLAVLAAIGADDGIRSLTISGTDGIFCAGADLKGDLQSGSGRDGPDPIVALSMEGGSLFHRVNACRVPVIAVIDGAAFGGGVGLACCADIVICGARARFALSETRLGLVPAQIAPFVVARLGLNAARRLALTGRRLGPEEAVGVGLADAAFADEAALANALQSVLSEIGQCAPGANAVTKALLLSLAIPAQDDNAFIARAAQIFADAVSGREGSEGVAAFAEKRKPDWIL